MRNSPLLLINQPTKPLSILQDYCINAIIAFLIQIYKKFHSDFLQHNAKCSNHAWKEHKRVDLNIFLKKLSTLSHSACIWPQSKNSRWADTIVKFMPI